MNTANLTLVIAQLDFPVGDIAGNAAKILAKAREAKEQFQADLIVFPELTLTGYPPEDLLLRHALHIRVNEALQKICDELIPDIIICIGYPKKTPQGMFNCASFITQGKILCTHAKHHLPNYSVFDEKRYFISGDTTTTWTIKGIQVGLIICEDIWFTGPFGQTCAKGADIILCVNASPFHTQKTALRQNTVRSAQHDGACPVVYINSVGGQDELVFDGGSFLMDSDGNVQLNAPLFEEALLPITFSKSPILTVEKIAPSAAPLSDLEAIYRALVLGIRDYVKKNHFPGILLGLSGGIDSALTLALAVDALGKDACHAVLMPSEYTQEISVTDAMTQAKTMGVTTSVIPINAPFQTILSSLAADFKGLAVDTTEENIQARLRGLFLMALSNKSAKLLLTTGNKSEMAVGYCTLYGDMNGGFAPLKDVPKTLVYALAHHRNQQSHVIPLRVITRAPSAELKPNQTDQDSLPDYAILDAIMALYVEDNASREDILAQGFVAKDVDRILLLINRNEYKRRQSPPGVRITARAFGRDWRLPITSGWTP